MRICERIFYHRARDILLYKIGLKCGLIKYFSGYIRNISL